MGYFPNGSAGEAYEARYCDRCVHQGDPDDGPWCVVWTLHLVHNYDQLKPENVLVKETLDVLIPDSKDGLGCDECRMFVARDEHEPSLPVDVEPTATWQAELKL